MKNILIALSFFFIALQLPAQQVNGFYAGTLVNDSNSMVQQYELALSTYKGRITGYSYVTFVANDTFYYGIRRVKAQMAGGQLLVTDDEFIANNFPQSPAKGVKRIFVFPLSNEDTVRTLSGSWQTNRTKTYYSIPGKARLLRSKDSSQSALLRHLAEMDRLPTVAAAPPATVKADKKTKPAKDKEAPAPPPSLPAPPALLSYKERTSRQAGAFELSGDSLTLSLYDNGVIDGDSISVYVNGVNVLKGTRLTASATRKKIAFAEDGLEILLVAENLGSIPPNTGLLVIGDGRNSYQLHFTADLQTNATIRVSRKK